MQFPIGDVLIINELQDNKDCLGVFKVISPTIIASKIVFLHISQRLINMNKEGAWGKHFWIPAKRCHKMKCFWYISIELKEGTAKDWLVMENGIFKKMHFIHYSFLKYL